MGSKHLYWLDWVRFISALLVVACHARRYTWVDWDHLNPHDHTHLTRTFYTLTEHGEEWVTIFFVLSGFLVGGKVIERSIAKTFNPSAFAVDRITRLWVPMVPAFLLTTAAAFYWNFPISFAVMLGNFLCLQGIFCDNYGNNIPLWSLSYEGWFYILAGLAATVVMRKNISRLWLALGLAVCFAVFTHLWAIFLYCWLIGAFSYFLATGKKSIGICILGFLITILGICLFDWHEDPKLISGPLGPWLPARTTAEMVESCGLSIFLADICRREPLSFWMMRFERLGTSLAAFSYTLYLTHYPVVLLWERFMPGPGRYPEINAFSLFVYICKVGATLLVAWLLYLPFEAQTPAIRRWLKKRLGLVSSGEQDHRI
jgi:peptidoglycan/LPS O-acetylase OafA/YrhL